MSFLINHPARTGSVSRRAVLTAGAAALALGLSACAPGSSTGTSTASSAAVNTALPTEPVTVELYFQSGGGNFDLPQVLAEEYSRQHPNVTFKFRKEPFQQLTENGPRVIASDSAPDGVRLPQIVGPATDGLLANLDGYAAAYGWDKFPASQLEQMRVDKDGSRGKGSLYAMGMGYNVTGVFYNKELAAKIGMTKPPATIAELDELLAKSKAAGQVPIMVFNDIGGVAFPFQAVLNQLADPAKVSAWTLQQPGATIDTPETVKAARHIADWAAKGYFPDDANALDYSGMMGRFTKGEGLFMFNGDWESAFLDKAMAGKVGFFLMPVAEPGKKLVAMGAPGTWVIPEKAKHKDVMANFLNWITTNEKARQIGADITGANPGGPATLPAPKVAEGSLAAQTLAAARQIDESGVLVDFAANATPGIYASTIKPELQLLITGRETPEDFAKKLQAAYEQELK